MPSDLVLTKPNIALVLMPKSGKLTVTQRKLVNSLFFVSVHQLLQYRNLHNSEPKNTHKYSCHVDSLLDPIERGQSNQKSNLRHNLTALSNTPLDFEAPDAKSGVIWSNMKLLSSVQFEIRGGSFFVNWSYPPDINSALLDTHEFPFTALDLQQIAQLSSYAAVALYEICARYRNNYLKGGAGECLTSSGSTDWWTDALSGTPPKVDPTTNQLVRTPWRKFKFNTLNDAIQEINTLTDLKVELKETREGRAVSSVQFVVRQTKSQPKQVSKEQFELFQSGLLLGVPEIQTERLIQQYSPNQMKLAFAKLQARKNAKDLPEVQNSTKYLRSILSDRPDFEITEEPASSESKPPPPPALPPSTSSDPELDLAKQQVYALPESSKRELGMRALDHLEQKVGINNNLRQRAQSGIWTGLLLSTMIQIFRQDQRQIIG